MDRGFCLYLYANLAQSKKKKNEMCELFVYFVCVGNGELCAFLPISCSQTTIN